MSPDEENARAIAQMKDYLHVNRMRCTVERLRILEYVCKQEMHFDADKIYSGLLQDKFYVSRASVYNTLELLVHCKLLMRHRFDTRKTFYERLTVNQTHHHRICMQCGSVKEFSDVKIRKAILRHEFAGFMPTNYSLYVYGICKKCAAKNQRAVKAKKNSNN